MYHPPNQKRKTDAACWPSRKRQKNERLGVKLGLIQLISQDTLGFLNKHVTTRLSEKRAHKKLLEFVSIYNNSSIDRDVAINLICVILWYIFKHETDKLKPLFSLNLHNLKTLEIVDSISRIKIGDLINEMTCKHPLVQRIQNSEINQLGRMQLYISSTQYHNIKIPPEIAIETLECVSASDPRACQEGGSCVYLVQCKHNKKMFDTGKRPMSLDSKFHDNNKKCLLCERFKFRQRLQSGDQIFDSCYVETGYFDQRYNMQYSTKYNLVEYEKTLIVDQSHLVKGTSLNC